MVIVGDLGDPDPNKSVILVIKLVLIVDGADAMVILVVFFDDKGLVVIVFKIVVIQVMGGILLGSVVNIGGGLYT